MQQLAEQAAAGGQGNGEAGVFAEATQYEAMRDEVAHHVAQLRVVLEARALLGTARFRGAPFGVGNVRRPAFPQGFHIVPLRCPREAFD